METALQRNYQVLNYHKQASFTRTMKLGFIGGLAGTLIMELFLMGPLIVVGMPALTFLSFIGDTIAQLLARFGIHLADGVPMCLAMQYLIGAIFGIIFVTVQRKVNALHTTSLKKGILQAVIFAEIISQPLLAMTTILLKMPVKDTLLWYGASLIMHFLYGITLGAIVSYGLHSVKTTSIKRNLSISSSLPSGG
jgi:hypothetical protein